MKDFIFYARPLKSKESDIVLLLVRLFIGILMLLHGFPKLMNFSTVSMTFPDPFGLGSPFALFLALGAEVGCSLLLIMGGLTRLASFVLVINMLVAAFYAHAGDPFQAKELAILYLAFYLLIFLMGAGRYSLDQLVFDCKRKDKDVQ
ncbi:DoxX family protein [Odoribacter sp. OttesenSCG-928-J03]|nr:DoxX family protein [Odoribacter sp. OttesenSCG-928-J03]